MQKFVVISTQRSGSRMLIESLSSHPDILCYGEIFLPKARYGDSMFVPPGRDNFLFSEYRNDSIAERIDKKFRKNAYIRRFLADFSQREKEAKTLGFKLMYSDINRDPYIFDWIIHNDVKIIHLVRMDILRTTLSGIISVERGGVSHATRKLALVTIRINPQELIKKMERHLAQIDLFRGKISKAGGHIEVGYEAFVENREHEGRRMLDFLNITPYTELSTKLVKQNVYSLSQIIENYDEVLEVVKGTRYMEYFL